MQGFIRSGMELIRDAFLAFGGATSRWRGRYNRPRGAVIVSPWCHHCSRR